MRLSVTGVGSDRLGYYGWRMTRPAERSRGVAVPRGRSVCINRASERSATSAGQSEAS